ncbi:putative reverse transcriptase domain-containing protein [Tanacetum coccineum]
MEIDIKEDENELELTYPYEEVDHLNPPPPAFEFEPDDETEVENPIEHEDETVPVSVYKVGESSTAVIPREDGDRLLPGFMRRDINSLFVRSSMEQGTVAMEKLVEKLGNVEEKVKCKKLKKELEEASVNAAIAAERARQTNVRNEASGSGPVRGRDTAPAACEWFEKTESVFKITECAEGKKVKFVVATLEGQALTWWKTNVATMDLETVNQMPWTEMKQLMTAEFCPIEEIQHMEYELWNLKVKEYDIVA